MLGIVLYKMGKGLSLEELKEMFGMEQELDIPMKDRFHNQLTDEQLSELTCTKGSYPAELEEKCETDYSALEAKVKELEAKYKK